MLAEVDFFFQVGLSTSTIKHSVETCRAAEIPDVRAKQCSVYLPQCKMWHLVPYEQSPSKPSVTRVLHITLTRYNCLIKQPIHKGWKEGVGRLFVPELTSCKFKRISVCNRLISHTNLRFLCFYLQCRRTNVDGKCSVNSYRYLYGNSNFR